MTAVILLSLCSAIAYGLSDFIGGVLTRRANVWAIAATSQGTAALLTVGLVLTNAGTPDARHMLLSVLAGLGSGAGNLFIYRGLAAGRMAVVAPLSGIAAAALPVLVGIVGGERLDVRPLIGILTALPAIWLVSGGGSGLADARRVDVVHGLTAGVGFGVQFSALGFIPQEAGLGPPGRQPGRLGDGDRRRCDRSCRALVPARSIRPARRRRRIVCRNRHCLLPIRRTVRTADHRGGADLALPRRYRDPCGHNAARTDRPRARPGVGPGAHGYCAHYRWLKGGSGPT